MSQRGRLILVQRIGVVALILALLITAVPLKPQTASAATITQTTDTDFATGIFNNTELIGSGASAHIAFENQSTWINRNPTTTKAT